MADQDSVRQRIIASVFSRRAANGAPEDTYISHIKIWEDDGSGRKARYILLSQTSTGAGVIHKSKLNTNGSFSVGKTWRLPEMRAIEVLNPLSFNITLARTYKWQTESQKDQANFLVELVRLFRQVTGGSSALQIMGFEDPDTAPPPGKTPVQGDFLRSSRNGAQNNGISAASPRRVPTSARPATPQNDDLDPYPRNGSPGSRSQTRGGLPSRPASANSNGSFPVPAARARPTTPTQYRSPSPTQSQSGNIRPRPGLRPLNGASTSGSIPEINFPPQNPSTRTPAGTPPNLRSLQDPNAKRPTLDVNGPQSFTTNSPQSAYSPMPALQTTSRSTRNDRPSSPASSTRSRKPSSRGVTPTPPEPPQNRREHHARVSFFDPANQAALDRLIASEPGGENGAEGEEETAQATMTSVEEMLEGYEWASEDVIGRKTAGGTADLIEARLIDELMALEKANIHSFLESDDRINIVVKFLDEAISELDNMDSLVSSYKIHLNAVGDDISYIQSQNRGLQVQTQNQQALLKELQNLLQTVHVDTEALMTLQESLEKASNIQRLEGAATELYKALQAGRDTEMAATMERLDEYRTHNSQFCKRIYDFLSIMATAQSKMILNDSNGLKKSKGTGRIAIMNHEDMEHYLGRYAGLMLYLKEMDENIYGKLCAAYFSAASDLHGTQVKALMTTYIGLVKKASDDDNEQNFSVTPTNSSYKAAGSIRRAGTVIRSPIEGRRDKGKDKPGDGELSASEAFGEILSAIAPQIYREDEFLADFLHINDAGLTFADYAGLDNYFRRQASRSAGLSQSTMKLIRSAMDLIFGFLTGELKAWLDSALVKDGLQIVGILASLERFLVDADKTGNPFLLQVLEKQRMRLKGLFDRHVNDQIKGVEQTKLTSKKRKGVAHFIKHFPVYIGKVENQLIGADNLDIRNNVDEAYEKIVQSMFDCLKQMAKMDGEGEDKGQLNYHVILIENMHYFVAEIAQSEVGSVSVFMRRAESIYEENLSAYVKIILRRPFAKIIDYFDGVERLLKTTAPTEVSSNSSYNKSALKKVVREFNSKDVRKHVDNLFKRVEKHFIEASEKATTEESGGITPGTVMVGAWKACEEELLRYTDGFSKRISQCYADSGVALEFTPGDVEAAFRRHRIGS